MDSSARPGTRVLEIVVGRRATTRNIVPKSPRFANWGGTPPPAATRRVFTGSAGALSRHLFQKQRRPRQARAAVFRRWRWDRIFHVSEELALERVCQSAEFHREKRSVAPWTFGVNGVRHELFPVPPLASNEHGGLSLRDQRDALGVQRNPRFCPDEEVFGLIRRSLPRGPLAGGLVSGARDRRARRMGLLTASTSKGLLTKL